MTSTVWRDGYGTAIEVHHGTPEVCPDGEVRTWHEVTVTDDEYAQRPPTVTFRIGTDDLSDLANVLRGIAAVVAS